jgi:hypothetical protein
MSTGVSGVRAASIIRAMTEAARTSDTLVDIQLRTRQYIPEDSELRVTMFTRQPYLSLLPPSSSSELVDLFTSIHFIHRFMLEEFFSVPYNRLIQTIRKNIVILVTGSRESVSTN